MDAFLEAWAQNRMRKVGHRLITASNSETLGHGAATQFTELGKDEPHPVRCLVPHGNFVEHVGVDLVLSFDKMFQLLCIQIHKSFVFGVTSGLSRLLRVALVVADCMADRQIFLVAAAAFTAGLDMLQRCVLQGDMLAAYPARHHAMQLACNRSVHLDAGVGECAHAPMLPAAM